MTFQEVNPGIMDEFERKLGSLEGVSATPAVRASLKPAAKVWDALLPKKHEKRTYPGVKGTVVVRAKKLRGNKFFGIVGGDRSISEHARLLHLLDLGHKTRLGAGTGRGSKLAKRKGGRFSRKTKLLARTRAFQYRKRALESTQSARDAILQTELDKIVDKVLGG